jgi:death-on-curing protein
MTGAEPVWIEERDVLMLHDRLLAFHGGLEGVRDQGLLQSALARAKQLAAYDESADCLDMATAYTAGIVKNHPFVDMATRSRPRRWPAPKITLKSVIEILKSKSGLTA